MNVEQIAAGITLKRREYLDAVGNAGGGYEPRHGRAAFWALSEGLTDTVLHYDDGSTALWGDPDRPTMTPFRIGGRCLTPFGLEVRAILEKQP
jgi:hypothetical protein